MLMTYLFDLMSDLITYDLLMNDLIIFDLIACDLNFRACAVEMQWFLALR